MIRSVRQWYNQNFSDEKYKALLEDLKNQYNEAPNFRISESPFFIPSLLKKRLLEACEEITEVLLRSDLKKITQPALYDPRYIVPGEDEHTTFLQMDFGITLDEKGEPFPKLIEIQGFPSVYFFQTMISGAYKRQMKIPDHFSAFFNNMKSEEYVEMLRKIIVGDSNPENVVLLEIEPEKQTTYIDMLSTSVELGIPCLCITKVIKSGKKLFYENKEGEKTEIKKIYNRVIFDELDQRPDLNLHFSFTDDLEVEWIGHPNWFFRISKFMLPFLKSKYVPRTFFLNDLTDYPEDLENYVLKPLFSFAGAGVIIDVTKNDLESVEDKNNYILQEKVHYEPIIESPEDPVKCEIRLLMLWPKEEKRPFIVNNLVRMSKGKMVGVKYNKDKTWVGASVGLFES
jgi:glutathionylspermidine synthase